MQPNHFFKNLSLLLLLNVLVKPVWIFLIDRAVQNRVGFEVYGRYFALLNLSYILLFIADAGLSNMLNQRMAKEGSINIRQIIYIKLALLSLYASACACAGLVTGINAWNIFLYIVLIQVFNSAFLFLRSIITANQYFRQDAWFSILDKGLMVLLCAVPLYMPFFSGVISLELFLQLQLLSTGIAITAATIFLLQKKIRWNNKKENRTAIGAQVVPFAVIILLMSAHYRLDGFLLERLHPNGALESGVYAAAYRLLDAANMIGYLAASFLVPYIAKHQHDSLMLNRTILLTRHAPLFAGISIAAFVWMHANWLQQLLYHNTYPDNVFVIQLCLATLPAYLLTHIYGSVLTATKSFRHFIAVLIVSVAINACLNALLIPMQGAAGATKAALVSQCFCAAGCMLAAGKKVALYLTSFVGYLILATVLFLLFFAARTFGLNVWISIMIAFILAGLVIVWQRDRFKNYFTPFQ